MTDKEAEIQELKKRLDELEQSNKPQETIPPKQKESSSGGCFTWFLGVLAFFAVVSLFSTLSDTDISKTSQQLQAERDKGFHCLSEWDGSHSGLVRLVKKTLRNPSSFKHVSTKIGRVDGSGEHFVSMTYRAENGFGGLNTELSTGTISNSSCSLVSFNE
jgi:hypothetical protein